MFDPISGTLTSIYTSKSGNPVIQDIGIFFDSLGNLPARHDNAVEIKYVTENMLEFSSEKIREKSYMMLKKIKLLTASVMFVCMLGGCASTITTVAPKPPENYTRLGPATGSACGNLGLFGTAMNFIPMSLNDRVQRAYDEAVNSVPGATGLVDVTVHENWYWWFVATARCVTITGEAVK